jgi:MFS superfamily sulfate permease-like transporter
MTSHSFRVWGLGPAAHSRLLHSATAPPAGAKTPLANMVCGLLVGFVLLVLCPVFERIPMNVLGAIIIVGVAGGGDCSGKVHHH